MLLRTTFSAPMHADQLEGEVGRMQHSRPGSIITTSSEEQFGQQLLDGESPSSSSNALYERVLNGRTGGRHAEVPEVYAGKTGLELPIIRLGPMSKEVKAAYTGPDGGLTQVQQMRQQPIVRMANLGRSPSPFPCCSDGRCVQMTS